jgi:hypothetical protein
MSLMSDVSQFPSPRLPVKDLAPKNMLPMERGLIFQLDKSPSNNSAFWNMRSSLSTRSTFQLEMLPLNEVAPAKISAKSVTYECVGRDEEMLGSEYSVKWDRANGTHNLPWRHRNYVDHSRRARHPKTFHPSCLEQNSTWIDHC